MPTAREQQALDSKLEILIHASATLLGWLRTDELVPRILDLARELNTAAACALWREERASGCWRIVSSLGLSNDYVERPFDPASAGPLSGDPFCFEDVSNLPSIADSRRALYQAEGIQSLMAMPMRIGGRVSATLAFYYREPHRFSEIEKRVAGTLAR